MSKSKGYFGTDPYNFQYWFFFSTSFGVNLFKSKLWSRLYKIYNLLMIGTHLSISLFLLFELKNAARVGSKLVTRTMGLILLEFGNTTKLQELRLKKKKISDLHWKLQRNLRNLKLESTPWAREVREEFRFDFWKLSTFMYLLGFVTIFLFFQPTFTSQKRELPLPFSQIDSLDDLTYSLTYCWHTFIILNIGVTYLSFDMMACGLIMRLCVFQKLIAKNILNFTRSFPYTDFSRYVPSWKDFEYNDDGQKQFDHRIYGNLMEIEHRGFTRKPTSNSPTEKALLFLKINFVFCRDVAQVRKIIDDTYAHSILVQFVGGIFVLVLFGVVAFVEDWKDIYTIQQLFFVGCTFIDFFIYCYCGNKFQEQGEKLSHAIYDCPWYEMDIPARKFIFCSLQMIQINPTFTAGGHFPVNLFTYLQLIKISYNYLTVMKNIM